MESVFTTWGALSGLILAIVLIVRKATPAYALIFGALLGGLLGGGGLEATVSAMVAGTRSMMPSILRILSSGILVGALVKTGSAAKIADAIVDALGTRFALAAIALATLIVTSVGVFVDIAVITVAPVALAVGRKTSLPVPALLLAMIGGGKAGNVISPNPNTLAVAEAFKLDLTSVIAVNVVPALVAMAVTVWLATGLAKKAKVKAGGERRNRDFSHRLRRLPSPSSSPSPSPSPSSSPRLLQAIVGPLTVVVLLSLRPLCGITVDPLVALPAGGLVSILVCGRGRETVAFCEYGLSKVIGVSILLIGTGTIAGIITQSGLNANMIRLMNACPLPVFALAPVSSFLLGGATASTTAGVTIASQTFAGTFAAAGVPALSAAAMLHAGGTICDALPHGSFFHATAGAVGMSVRDRFRLFPYGELVGLTTTVVSVLIYLLFGKGV